MKVYLISAGIPSWHSALAILAGNSELVILAGPMTGNHAGVLRQEHETVPIICLDDDVPVPKEKTQLVLELNECVHELRSCDVQACDVVYVGRSGHDLMPVPRRSCEKGANNPFFGAEIEGMTRIEGNFDRGPPSDLLFSPVARGTQKKYLLESM